MGSWSGGMPQESKIRYACFECQKAFKEYKPWTGVKCCPNCKGEVHLMSVYWYPPKKTDDKMWQWSRQFDRCGRGCNKEPAAEPKYEFLPNYKKPKK